MKNERLNNMIHGKIILLVINYTFYYITKQFKITENRKRFQILKEIASYNKPSAFVAIMIF